MDDRDPIVNAFFFAPESLGDPTGGATVTAIQ